MITATNDARDEQIQCSASDSFNEWMADAGGSLAITTYQAGKVALLGWNGSQTTVLLRDFEKPMGLAVQGHRLALATRHAIWLLANAPLLAPDYLEDQRGRYDSLYLPRAAYFTGDINVHDLAFGIEGLWLVNTRFCCLASLSKDFSFVPRWKPAFVSDIVPEDRCHLNGLAMREGRPKFVTALGETDEPGAWRPAKASGGLIIDVDTGAIVVRGLSMPHSPRWYDGRLWVLNSGRGELWVIDPRTGEHEVICVLPGYLRGLAFAGPHAIIGLCRIRERHIFGGLPVQEQFRDLQCGAAVVDVRSGQMQGLFEFTAGCHELYDVQFLPGVTRPMVLNVDKDATRQAFTAPDLSYWLRPSSEVPISSGSAPPANPA